MGIKIPFLCVAEIIYNNFVMFINKIVLGLWKLCNFKIGHLHEIDENMYQLKLK